MTRYCPILLIWLTVGLNLIDLLGRLQLFQTDFNGALTVLSTVMVVISVASCWVTFQNESRQILDAIGMWDEDMKKDIPVFLQVRKFRLISALSLVSILLIVKWAMPWLSDQKQFQEIFSYIFLIILFHVTLVTTLMLFKMSSTLAWIRYENYLEKLEEA